MAADQTFYPSRALDVPSLLNSDATAGATSHQSLNVGPRSEVLETRSPAQTLSGSPSGQSPAPSSSQATSPSASYPPLSEPSHASLVSYLYPLVTQKLQPYLTLSRLSSRGIQQGGECSTGSTPESGFLQTPGAWQQNKNQLYFNSGEQGSIPVPVDIHCASKQADERRERNAGASARFRARRKEKELEASHTIAKLEQQIRDLTEERDFYRAERDYFRSVLYSGPQQGQPQPRPLSPRLRLPVEQVQDKAAEATSCSPRVESRGITTGRHRSHLASRNPHVKAASLEL
ncbi:MAG: hypothetical protein M1840_003263 [Geoglossum simile]|nr:MAG: hypothetical protein M1840_003263 [Geoglossum simile]